MDKSKNVTEEKLNKYFSVTEEAYEEASKNINEEKKEEADIILDMAKRYIDDAHFFKEKKGDFVTAFAALNYSHGWIDVGSKLGMFNVKNDKLFIIN